MKTSSGVVLKRMPSTAAISFDYISTPFTETAQARGGEIFQNEKSFAKKRKGMTLLSQ